MRMRIKDREFKEGTVYIRVFDLLFHKWSPSLRMAQNHHLVSLIQNFFNYRTLEMTNNELYSVYVVIEKVGRLSINGLYLQSYMHEHT